MQCATYILILRKIKTILSQNFPYVEKIRRPNFVVMQSKHNVYPYVEIKIHVSSYFNSLCEIHVFVEIKASIFKATQRKLLTSDSMHNIHQ